MNNNQYEMSGSEAEIWSQIGGLKEAVRENRRQQCALSESDGEIRAQIAELSAAYLEMQQQRPASAGEFARNNGGNDFSKGLIVGVGIAGGIAALLYWACSGTDNS